MKFPPLPRLMRGRETLKGLLKRAAMSIFSYNTGVVHPMDGNFRIGVGTALDHTYGDCVAVSVHQERNNPDRLWQFTHLSPARARVLALHLLRFADYIENRKNNMGYGGGCIDKPFGEKLDD